VATDFVYDITFHNVHSNGNIDILDTGRAARGIEFFNMVGTSGSVYPDFQGASSGVWTDQRGVVYRKFENGVVHYTDPDGVLEIRGTDGATDRFQVDATGVKIGANDYIDTAWADYSVATPTAETGTFTSASSTGRQKPVGKTRHITQTVSIPTPGSATGYVQVDLPVAKKAGVNFNFTASSNQGYSIIAKTVNDTTLRLQRIDGSSPIVAGAVIEFSGTYETA